MPLKFISESDGVTAYRDGETLVVLDRERKSVIIGGHYYGGERPLADAPAVTMIELSQRHPDLEWLKCEPTVAVAP